MHGGCNCCDYTDLNVLVTVFMVLGDIASVIDTCTVLSQASAQVLTAQALKNWRWAVAQKRCLNGSTLPVQAPTQDAKLAARGY